MNRMDREALDLLLGMRAEGKTLTPEQQCIVESILGSSRPVRRSLGATEANDEIMDNWRTNTSALGMEFDGSPPVLYLDPSDNESDLDSSDELMICDICEQSLNRFSTHDGETWVHARPWQKHGHDPVPRAVPKETMHNQVCDFCGVEAVPYWTYTGQRMRMGAGNTVHDYGTVWGACEHCGNLINDKDLEGLGDRVMRISPLGRNMSREEQIMVRANAMSMWITFLSSVDRKQYIGPQREPARLNPRMMPKLQRGLLKFWRHPGLRDKLNQHRAEKGMTYSMPAVHCGQEDQLIVEYGPDVEIPEPVWRNHVDHLSAGIEGSELFWISSNFTALSIMAGKDFETVTLSRDELPAKFGFMIYEDPIGEIPRPYGNAAIRGVTWTLVPGGIWLNLYIQAEDSDPEVDIEAMRAETGWLMCPNNGSGIIFDAELPRLDNPSFQFIYTIFATWFLMNQAGVAERQAVAPDKKLARAFKRTHNRPMPDVQLVDLRRAPSRPGRDGENHTGRKLTVRVYRRGHWKQQAYGPKRGMRKNIYVSGYIAGPDGAPLKARPTQVKVLR